MSPQRMDEDRLRELFDQVSELPPGERDRFLESATAGDAALRKEIRELLVSDAAANKEEFWQHSAIYNQAMADHAADSAVGEKVGQYRLVELIGKEQPILDGIDDALGQAARPRVTRQAQSGDDRSREHQNPAVLLHRSGGVFHASDGRRRNSE